MSGQCLRDQMFLPSLNFLVRQQLLVIVVLLMTIVTNNYQVIIGIVVSIVVNVVNCQNSITPQTANGTRIISFCIKNVVLVHKSYPLYNDLHNLRGQPPMPKT